MRGAARGLRCAKLRVPLLPGEQPAGGVRGVGEAALALYCLPRRVARGTRGAARGPDSARVQRARSMGQPARRERRASLAHRLHAAVNSLVDGGQSHDCRSKPAGFVTPFTQSLLSFAFSFACFYFVFSFAKRRRGGRAGANYGQLHVEGSRTTTRRLGRLGRAAPSRTGRAPYPARRRSHSDV